MNINTSSRGRVLAALAVGAVAVGMLAGCSGSDDGGGTDAPSSDTYTLWDPYPDRDASSDWAKVIDACAADLDITIDRNAGNTGDTVKDLTTAAPNLPDIALVDNPKVSTLAEAGLLTTTADNGLDVSNIEKNILSAGELDGDVYGVPVGANTLGLYYNPAVLEAAGVDIASVTDFASLTDALTKVVAAGKKGITFSAVGTEEGSFQFLPWFWGAGGDLTQLDSPEAVASLELWTNWVKDGLAPNSVLQNTQGTSWDEFLTGEYAFAENGSWFKGAADEAGYLSMQVPGIDGDVAAAPTGGEFITIPIQKDTARYATSVKIVECLTDGNTGADALGYVAPTAEGQAAQLEADPTLEGWITAVGDAKPRTADNLGTAYPIISEQLFTAVQNSLSGASTPADALAKAQTDAASKLP
ncbi:extracellular solute-binding protein [Microbacterium sp. WCS2018Hpa-23]|uniref:sugar ABC transporter substrate-binding protein n=1 Tax=Microbacterium sp. WCS2018Hpa-23 TaxID=3073634 RepID=UPI002882FDE0|nr:extracellular solute-binding protein [Microbacterium sp. WCS2018Hpa-23]